MGVFTCTRCAFVLSTIPLIGHHACQCVQELPCVLLLQWELTLRVAGWAASFRLRASPRPLVAPAARKPLGAMLVLGF